MQRSGLTSRTAVGGGYRYMHALCPLEADNNGMIMLRDIMLVSTFHSYSYYCIITQQLGSAGDDPPNARH